MVTIAVKHTIKFIPHTFALLCFVVWKGHKNKKPTTQNFKLVLLPPQPPSRCFILPRNPKFVRLDRLAKFSYSCRTVILLFGGLQTVA